MVFRCDRQLAMARSAASSYLHIPHRHRPMDLGANKWIVSLRRCETKFIAREAKFPRARHGGAGFSLPMPDLLQTYARYNRDFNARR